MISSYCKAAENYPSSTELPSIFLWDGLKTYCTLLCLWYQLCYLDTCSLMVRVAIRWYKPFSVFFKVVTDVLCLSKWTCKLFHGFLPESLLCCYWGWIESSPVWKVECLSGADSLNPCTCPSNCNDTSWHRRGHCTPCRRIGFTTVCLSIMHIYSFTFHIFEHVFWLVILTDIFTSYRILDDHFFLLLIWRFYSVVHLFVFLLEIFHSFNIWYLLFSWLLNIFCLYLVLNSFCCALM